MVKHSLAVCNYNMVNTVEESIRSMVNQLDDSFEVVVVDDGSDDGSVEILRSLESEYDCLRVVELDYDPTRGLGETRNISFKESKGDYILESLDTDDKYDDGILDFVELYHQINSQVEFEFYLKGSSINMAPRELLLDIPYRDLGRGQDRDLWRRLFASNSIIWIKHDPFYQTIGYDPNLLNKLNILYDELVTEFRSGITFTSFIKHNCDNITGLKNVYLFTISPIAFIQSCINGRYAAPDGFEKKGRLEKVISEQQFTLSELEREYGINIDQSNLTDKGKRYFLSE